MTSILRAGLAVLAGIVASAPAEAHVKWFAPYIVGAPPQPIVTTLANPWFWIGIALVLLFFIAAWLVEQSRAGEVILRGMDRITDPLWRRLDDFVRAVVAAFFVAIFAVGGVYLTPDLRTPAEWVSWVQLLIACLIFSRRTQPLAAVGLIGLWLMALRDYDVFHLLDYLALECDCRCHLIGIQPESTEQGIGISPRVKKANSKAPPDKSLAGTPSTLMFA